MGYGDVLMSMGQARALHKSNTLPVVIVGRDGRPIKSDLFNGVPYLIFQPKGRPHTRLVNGPGVRPYIAGKTDRNWTWRPFKPTPAEIVFTREELAFAEPCRGMVMVEPNVKNIGHTNKAWLPQRWLELSRSRDDFVQCVQTPDQGLPPHVLKVITPTFRHALAVLSVCKAFIGTEGGLMHGAAAVGSPAVILWSEFISPEITGYASMRNIRHAGKACGSRVDCPGCRKSMEAITVQEVMDNLGAIL